MENEQDEGTVKAILRHQDKMEAVRAPWENIWREVEALVDPVAAGGFSKQSAGSRRDLDIFDPSAIKGLKRFAAALGAVTTPRRQRWHGVGVGDKDLAKLPEVQRWNEHATDRLFAMRYAPYTGAWAQYGADRRQTGSYGTAALWVDEWKGRGFFYRALHLSEIYIDEDFQGRVDTVHRKFELSARQAEQQFGSAALPPKIIRALEQERSCDDKFQFLHVIRPNAKRETARLDWRGKPIESLYVALDEKWICQRGGYFTMPIAVSRNETSPGDIYGRSPAMDVLGTTKGLQQIARTLLRAAHKATDPALAFYDDGDISKLVTKPGGLNPGLVDQAGNLLVAAVPGGGNLPIGLDTQERERAHVASSFLEEFFRLLVDPSDRMTATQVLETVAKEGVLIEPFAGQYEAEKLSPMVDRELDIGLRTGLIDPMPEVMVEAGARPIVHMDNPLGRMARAQEASAFTRWVEIGVQAASAGRPEALDRINFDAGMRGVGEVLGVRPSWIKSDDELAAERQAREEKEAAAALGEVAPKVAGAALDLAKANEVAASLGQGGGL